MSDHFKLTTPNLASFAKSARWNISLEDIAAEWNANVDMRAEELDGDLDPTYTKRLEPLLLQLIEEFTPTGTLLDVGSGLGYLTRRLASSGRNTDGIDIAERALAFAREKDPSVRWIHSSVEDFARHTQKHYSGVVANMVLHNVVDLELVLNSISTLLTPSGTFLFSVPHPAFWFEQHARSAHPEFNYNKEAAYKVPFRVRGRHEHPSKITYVHRSLGKYVSTIVACGFRILLAIEPQEDLVAHYPDVLVVVARQTG